MATGRLRASLHFSKPLRSLLYGVIGRPENAFWSGPRLGAGLLRRGQVLDGRRQLARGLATRGCWAGAWASCPLRGGRRAFGRYCGGCRPSCRGWETVVTGVVSRLGAVQSSWAWLERRVR